MAVKYSVAVKNARLDAIETAIGASAVMQIRTGAPPASIADAATGTVIATLALPADWMAAAAGGVKSKSGTWSDLSADAAGTAGWFSIWNNAMTTRHMQGTITATGGGGDMTVDNTVLAVGQQFEVTAFGVTSGN